ncbi:MAG: DUF4276 family protein [Anaerolineae bacterium]|nr:DUF4276 family protein [Anaerolineae bacterium]
MKIREVIVYVEGPSDCYALEALLASLLKTLQTQGVTVKFIATGGKKRLMLHTPQKAVNILYNPYSIVIALPDLYPPNVGGPHRTPPELRAVLRLEFNKCLQRQGITDDRWQERFKVFCFKYDLEALILAAESQLSRRLGVSAMQPDWAEQVEDQNHHTPPKRIVEKLFSEQGKHYKNTVDAPLILGAANYTDIARACPQCFKPFVDFITSLPRAVQF